MKTIIPAIILISLSIILWIIFIVYMKSLNKKIIQYFIQLAEKYHLAIDESNKIGSVIYPVAQGIYKNRKIEIGCNVNNSGAKKSENTYIRVETSNPHKLSLLLARRTKNSTPMNRGNMVNMMDTEFDEKFIVSSSTPQYLFPVFTFNIKYSLLQALHLGMKGGLKLE